MSDTSWEQELMEEWERENVRLREEWERMREEWTLTLGENVAIRERVRVLEGALLRHGWHMPGCGLEAVGECDCGLAAALAPPADRTTKED